MTRKVVGNITLSLDGRVHGPGGESDMGWTLAEVTQAETGALCLLYDRVRS